MTKKERERRRRRHCDVARVEWTSPTLARRRRSEAKAGGRPIPSSDCSERV